MTERVFIARCQHCNNVIGMAKESVEPFYHQIWHGLGLRIERIADPDRMTLTIGHEKSCPNYYVIKGDGLNDAQNL